MGSEGFEGAQDWDLFEMTEQLENERSLTYEILYHWRASSRSTASSCLRKTMYTMQPIKLEGHD